MRDTLYVPAMTSVFPVNGTLREKIKFLQRQVFELEQQKKCYNKMISERNKLIKDLKKKKTMLDLVSKLGKNKKRPRRK